MARFQAATARPQMAVSAAGPVPMAPVSTASMGLVGPGIMRHAVALGPPISHAQMLHGGNMNMMRPGPPMGIHPGKLCYLSQDLSSVSKVIHTLAQMFGGSRFWTVLV